MKAKNCACRTDKDGTFWRCASCSKKATEARFKAVPSFRRDRRASDPETYIQEYGVQSLEKTSEGRVILEKARSKYKAELVQPGDPEFNKLYGKEVRARQEEKMEREREAKQMWEQSDNYQVFKERERAA